MDAKVGDHVVIESNKVGTPARRGTIEEVVQPDPLQLRVTWEDGNTTLLMPRVGSARIEKASATRGRSTKKSAKKSAKKKK